MHISHQIVISASSVNSKEFNFYLMSSHLYPLQLKGLYFSSYNSIHPLLNDNLAMPAMQETCLALIPGLGSSPGEGNGTPLQWGGFLVENPVDRGVWKTTVCGVTKSWTQLSHTFNVGFRTGFLIFCKIDS